MSTREQLWDSFCTDHRVAESAVLLFDSDDDLRVRTREIGQTSKRHVLTRSTEMESLIIRETERLVEDWKSGRQEFDGLIYMMFLKRAGKVIPLYIGKTETVGKGQNNLSANLVNLSGDKGKFARWGDNYAYHIGDLSAVVIPGHPEAKSTEKYQAWAESLFETTGIDAPKLKEPVHFWTKAWRRSAVGIWGDFGPTRLTFLEYLLIGVASAVYPDLLLNREGQSRG
jgi:hypothetical protein